MKKVIASIALMIAMLVVPVSIASAESVFEDACKDSSSTICKQTDPAKAQDRTDKFVEDVVATLIFAVGAISTIMIIVGAIRYTTSDGDANKITSAKNTILYAVIGLVVAIFAYAIVNFVLERL